MIEWLGSLQGRVLSYKTFFKWLITSLYQGEGGFICGEYLKINRQWHLIGAAIMIMSLVLFENEFLNIVAISFTSLVLNELIMVALEITTWYAHMFLPLLLAMLRVSLVMDRHVYMVISEVVTLFFYVVSIAFLPEFFGMSRYLGFQTKSTTDRFSFFYFIA